MALVATDGIVLHSMNYLESSRILRLATRDAGVQSVLAKGARRPKSGHGAALDLFAQGVAQLSMRPGRDLHTLTSFDVARSRAELAADLGRFTAASAIAELMLRFARDDQQPALYDALAAALDAIGAAAPGHTRAAALAGAWSLVAELGFGPTVDRCASCDVPLTSAAAVAFSHPAGGALCARCAASAPGARTLPAAARDALRHWLTGAQPAVPSDDAALRAHQRLLREFLHEHLADGRPLHALETWEHARWAGA